MSANADHQEPQATGEVDRGVEGTVETQASASLVTESTLEWVDEICKLMTRGELARDTDETRVAYTARMIQRAAVLDLRRHFDDLPASHTPSMRSGSPSRRSRREIHTPRMAMLDLQHSLDLPASATGEGPSQPTAADTEAQTEAETRGRDPRSN